MVEGGGPRVLVLGAGFGGLWAVRALRRAPFRITILDRNNFHTFLPLLYQVGAAELEPFAISRPVRTILRGQANAEFVLASARGLDLGRKIVQTSHGVHEYDYLIIAIGTVAWDLGIPGVRRHAYPLKTLEDGVALRSHVLSRFEAAMHEAESEDRRRLLRFVIVGGGPTGVEYAGALSELIRRPLARDYPELEGLPEILLLEAAPALLRGMPDSLGEYARRRLTDMGVDVRLEARVQRVEADAIHLADPGGSPIETTTVAWTAGTTAPAGLKEWGLPLAKDGRVRVESTLQVAGHPEVFAVGDIASPEAAEGDWPQLAQAAMQGGAHAADAIIRLEAGGTPGPFRYRDKGMMAVIGRNAAAASVRGREFTGFLAWLLWLGIHIVYLIGFRNRIAVMMNWAWGYITFERVARILLPFRRRAPTWPPSGTDDDG